MKYTFVENIQRGILFYFKTDKNFHIEVLTLIKPDYFEFPSHAKIFTIIKNYYEQYKKLPHDDIILEEVKKGLNKNEKLSDYTLELEYINNLDVNAYDDQYLMHIVEKFSRQQEMKLAIANSIPLIEAGKLDDVYSLVRDAALVTRNINVGQDYFADIDYRIKRLTNKTIGTKFKSILPTVDNTLEGGCDRKELTLVVAPAGVGKSLYLANQAVQSLKQGFNVLFLSFEMSEDKVAQRIDSIASNLSQKVIKSDKLRLKSEINSFRNNNSGKLFIKEFLGARENITTVRAYLNKLDTFLNFKPDLIVVDYLELLLPSRECVPHKEQEVICRDLRTLAQEFNCHVVTATQTNREGKRVNIITDVELADCYGKIRPCDLVLSLNQDTEEYDKGAMRAYVIKARDARKGYIVKMDVDYGTLTMKERK